MVENKNVDKRIIIVIIVLIILLLVLGLILGKKKNEEGGNKGNLTENEISNVEEFNDALPDVSFTISGAYQSKITGKEIKEMGLKVYKFDATIDNGWGYVKNKYVGIKLVDLLKSTKITESKTHELTFEGKNRTAITYSMDKINDMTYIVFLRDGKNVDSEQSVMLLNIDKDYSYSLNKLINIFVPHNIDDQVQ